MNQPTPLDNTLLLFSTPVFVCKEYSSTINDVHDTTNERKDVRENIGGNLASVQTKVLNLESYKIIRERIMFGLSQYVNDVLFVDPAYEFYITQSWLNFNEPGTTHHRHNHSNSLISGVYYIDTVPEDSIIFISNNNDTVTTNSTLQIDVTNYNLTNSNLMFMFTE